VVGEEEGGGGRLDAECSCLVLVPLAVLGHDGDGLRVEGDPAHLVRLAQALM
jgi:hypothetical protein